MVRHRIVQTQAADPTVGQIQMHFPTQAPFGTNAVAVGDDQHPDHQFGIDRRATCMVVVVGQVLAKFAQVESLIDAAQQIILGNVLFEIERVEQPVLPPRLLSHHLDCPRNARCG